MDVAVLSPCDLRTALVAERACLVIPANLDWIEPTVETLRQRAVQCGVCDEQGSGKVAMALHEALVNAIIHGNLGISSGLKEQGGDAFVAELARRCSDPAYARSTVRVDIDFDGECCRWQFTDQGKGFDYEARLRRLDEPPSEEDLICPSGRGLVMMRAFTDEMHFDLGGRRVQLTLRKRREEREHARWPSRQRAQLVPVRADGSVDWAAAQEAVARDLSASGVGLLKRGLAEADRVLIGLDVNGRTMYLPAEVRRCTAVGQGTVELGCRFQLDSSSAPPDSETKAVGQHLDSLLTSLQSQAEPGRPRDERRAHQRVSYSERVKVRTGEGRLVTAYARDLSRSGIAFITPAQLEPQTEPLTVMLPQTDGDPLAIPARIVRCRPLSAGFYDVAAAFLIPADG